jgi:hypothetical protein
MLFLPVFCCSSARICLLSFLFPSTHRTKHSLMSLLALSLSPSLQVWQNGRVEICANDQGNRITPSYVSFTEDEQRLIGEVCADPSHCSL